MRRYRVLIVAVTGELWSAERIFNLIVGESWMIYGFKDRVTLDLDEEDEFRGMPNIRMFVDRLENEIRTFPESHLNTESIVGMLERLRDRVENEFSKVAAEFALRTGVLPDVETAEALVIGAPNIGTEDQENFFWIEVLLASGDGTRLIISLHSNTLEVIDVKFNPAIVYNELMWEWFSI